MCDNEKVINKAIDALVFAYQKSDANRIRQIRAYIFNHKEIKSKETAWNAIVKTALWRCNNRA